MPDCTYRVDNLSTTGDDVYGARICNQPFIDYAWDAHGFNYDFWQEGWGWDDCCNIRKPLARALNAIWLLAYSADDWTNEDWNASILNWAPRYVREQMKRYDDLRAGCGGSSIATTSGWFDATWDWMSTMASTLWHGTVGRGQNVTLHLSFFYTSGATDLRDVVARASTLVHESRHIGARPHNADFPSGSVLGSGSGADESWSYEGAWMYHALYLWWFYAAGARTTIALRQSARSRANVIINNAFATHPGFVVT